MYRKKKLIFLIILKKIYFNTEENRLSNIIVYTHGTRKDFSLQDIQC